MRDTLGNVNAGVEAANTIAVAAVIVAVISLVTAFWALAVQRKHNFLSVRPLGFIARGDYENRLSVKIHNNGVGPLIIRTLIVSDGTEERDNLLDWMPALPENVLWDDFTKELEGRSLAPGDEIVLLKLSGDPDDSLFQEARDRCREVLRKLSVKMEYIDIYNQKMPTAHRKLDWFGRHISSPGPTEPASFHRAE